MNATADTSAGSISSIGAGSWRWNSPVPYLFGGLAAFLALIALALLALACSYRNSYPANSRSHNDAHNNKSGRDNSSGLPVAEMEPKIVVIMAGDEQPSYLAKPL